MQKAQGTDSIEKLNSGWSISPSEFNHAKMYPEVTFANLYTAIDLRSILTYNINALLMRRIGQR